MNHLQKYELVKQGSFGIYAKLMAAAAKASRTEANIARVMTTGPGYKLDPTQLAYFLTSRNKSPQGSLIAKQLFSGR